MFKNIYLLDGIKSDSFSVALTVVFSKQNKQPRPSVAQEAESKFDLWYNNINK